MAATLAELAALVRGRIVGDGSVSIAMARPVDEAGPGDITFVEGEKYARQLRTSAPSAAVVGPHFRLPDDAPAELPLIEVPDPLSAFLSIYEHLSGRSRPRWEGVHPLAYVAPTASIGVNAAVYPFAYVGDGAQVGDGCTIHPHAVVGAGSKLGVDCTLHPHVVLYEYVTLGDRVEVHSGSVLGGDGFGYRSQGGRQVKIPQAGTLEVGPDVEIGANCAIDRGTFGATTIGEGTKLDNLVMVGHNNRIGRHNVLCGQVGIAGSCRTGDHVVLAGQAGIKDHTQIGDRATVGAQTGVSRDVPSDARVFGTPAVHGKQFWQSFALIARLPEIHRQLRGLAAQVARLLGEDEIGVGVPASPDAETIERADPLG